MEPRDPIVKIIYDFFYRVVGTLEKFGEKGEGELNQNFRKNNIEWDLRKTNLRRYFC